MRTPEHLTVAFIDAGYSAEEARQKTFDLLEWREGGGFIRGLDPFEAIACELAVLDREAEERVRYRNALKAIHDRWAMTESDRHNGGNGHD